MEQRGPTHLDDLIAQAAGLRRRAVRLVGESDADDVLQDAVTAGIEHAPGDPRALRPWLARVVHNFAAGRHRGRSAIRAREASAARREAQPSTGDIVERMEVQRIVAEEVLRLDEPFRTTVLSLHFEGTSAEEYARTRGVPSATVRSWSKRGLDTLRTRLDKRFGGDRAAWSACLMPLARPEATLVPLVIGGGLVLKKALAASLVLLLAVVVVWTAVGVGGKEASPQPGADVAALELESQSKPVSPVAIVPAPALGPRAEIIPPPEPRSGPQIKGRVVWLPDRAPAVDIGVCLAHTAKRPDLGVPPSVATDSEGRFLIHAASAGPYDLLIDRWQHHKRIQLAPDEPLEVELELPRASKVVGRVLDLDGTPVAGAQVCVAAYAGQWSRCVARSDSDGSYMMEGIPVGPRVFARAPGRSPSGAYLLQDVKSPYALDLWLGGPAGAVEGHVRDATGNALVGVPLVIRPSYETITDPAGVRASNSNAEHATTGQFGAFAFRELRSGRNELEVHAHQRTNFAVSIDVRSGVTARVEIDLPATARIRGKVTDIAGKPVSGARIEVSRVDGTSASSWIGTDGEGRYDTGFAPAGRVRLLATHTRAGREEVETDLAPHEDREWSPVLGATAPIRGRVIDVTGRPLAGISVSCGGRNEGTVVTDAAGRFELSARASQPVGVQAWDAAGVRVERDSVLPGGPDIELVFEVPSARVRGRLVGANQLGPDLFLVCNGRKVELDAVGRFESHALMSGKHTLAVQNFGVVGCQLLEFELAPGETREIGDVTLPGLGTLVVALHPDEGVDPLRVVIGAHRIGVWWQAVYSHDRKPGQDWTVERLPEGSYRLTVGGGSCALVDERFEIRAGESKLVDVELHRGVPVRIDARGGRIPPWEADVLDEGGHVVGRVIHDAGVNQECIVNLRPGRYELVLVTKDGRKGRARVEVPKDATLEQYVAIEVP